MFPDLLTGHSSRGYRVRFITGPASGNHDSHTVRWQARVFDITVGTCVLDAVSVELITRGYSQCIFPVLRRCGIRGTYFLGIEVFETRIELTLLPHYS